MQLFFVSFLVTSSARYELIEKGFINEFSIQKFKEAEFFTRTDSVLLSVTSSARYELIEKGFINEFSTQKFKEAEFLLELIVLFVSPFECEVRAYREGLFYCVLD
jgi:hypothetical protein